jgi:hypothetical protein
LSQPACGFDPFEDAPVIGNPDGHCVIPVEAQPDDSTHPDQIVGSGNAKSCTADALQAALSQGGVIVFDCGDQPTTIEVEQTLVVFGSKKQKTVIDGGNKIALRGGGKRRLLFMNACDPAGGGGAPRCTLEQLQSLTVQNLILLDGDSTEQDSFGGGAVFVNAGKLKVVHCLFMRNRADTGDWLGGGGAIRTINQPYGSHIYIVDSTFGGNDKAKNIGINGGALSGIRTWYVVLNSDISYNVANGPDGFSSGGGIDINRGTSLRLCGVRMIENRSNGPGAAISFGGFDDDSEMRLENSYLSNNKGRGENAGYPGLKFWGSITVDASTIE